MRQAAAYIVLVLMSTFLALNLLRPSAVTSQNAAGEAAMHTEASVQRDPNASEELVAVVSQNGSVGTDQLESATVLPIEQRAEGETLQREKKIRKRESPESTTGMAGETRAFRERNVSADGNESNRTETNVTDGYIPWIGAVPVPVKIPTEGNETWREGEELFRLIEKIGGEMGDPVMLRLFKSERRLEIWMEVDGLYRYLTRYRICYYPGIIGPKRSGDDRQVPEGFYRITEESLTSAESRYRSIAVDYPNTYDRAQGWSGSGVKLYGHCGPDTGYGLQPGDMEEVYELVETAISNGQLRVALHLYPFYLSPEKMQEHEADRWYAFWENLKEGFDLFNRTRRVPWVWVEEGRYVFGIR